MMHIKHILLSDKEAIYNDKNINFYFPCLGNNLPVNLSCDFLDIQSER